MAFKRARCRLSTLATGSNNRKAKAISQTRSTSGSTFGTNSSKDPVSTDENSTGKSRAGRQSITFDKLFTDDEAHAVVALASKENSLSVSGLHDEAVPDLVNNQEPRASSSKFANRLTTQPEDQLSSHPAASGPSSGPVPSGSSSRRTTIFVGHSGHTAAQDSQEEQVIDETRLEGEESYYKFVDPAGQSRRRSMLRSVSKDDYLLARGANPRTGLVTPGVHSANSSYEAELLKQRGIIPPPKWRQKGDQWVSLDIGEPTPLSSPPRSPRKHGTGRPLRTPPRLTAGKYNHVGSSRTAYQKPSVSAALAEDVPTPDGVPGRFPITPQGVFTDASPMTRRGPSPMIKRKPVGNTSEANEHHVATELVTSQGSTDTVVKRPYAIQLRSSSAPMPRALNFETPDDVGKDFSKMLPSMPNAQKHSDNHSGQHLQFQEPFLGHQWPRGAGSALESKMSALSRPEKELPCLPMSNGQYQLQASAQPTTLTSHSMVIASSETPRIMGPRGGDLAYPFVRNTRMIVPPRHYQVDPTMSTVAHVRTPTVSIPIYDNPPSQRIAPSRPIRAMVGGPRRMHQPRSVSENIKQASNVFVGPPVTMCTNTLIPTHISSLQPRFLGRSHRMALGLEIPQEQRLYQHSQERYYPNDPRLWNRSMSSNTPIAMPGARPRAQSRPQMPDRADAHMRSVPRMNPYRSNQMGFTGSHHPWRMNGTSEEDSRERGGDSAANITRSEFEPKMMPNPLRPPHVTQSIVDPASFTDAEDWSKSPTQARISDNRQEDHSSRSSGLTRNCNRCQNGSTPDSLRNLGGQGLPPVPAKVAEQDEQRVNIEYQQQPLSHGPVVTEPTVAPNSASIEEEINERDHTACCTECCTVEDCHEGCLGHPSPSIRSFGGSTVVDTTSAPSSPDRGSPSVSVPIRTSSKLVKGKYSFVQGLRMRKTLRTRQCPDDGKTITERCDALESPPLEVDSHSLSHGPFWGDGQGAIAAAKKAVGITGRAVTTPKAARRKNSPPRLVIPKIRDLRSPNVSGSSTSVLPSRAPKSRNISAASNHSTIASASRSRNVSGTSILSIEIPHVFSSLGTIDVVGVLEMLLVPFEAAAMWIQTHPEFQQWLWKGVEKAISMARTIVNTSGTVWEVSYVYSKTGKWRCKRPGGIGRLVVDCGRSVGYLLVFIALAVCAGRVLGWVLGLAQGFLLIFRAVGWLIKNLGLGVLW